MALQNGSFTPLTNYTEKYPTNHWIENKDESIAMNEYSIL